MIKEPVEPGEPSSLWQRFARLFMAFGAAIELSDAEIANMRLARLEADLEELRTKVGK